MARKNRAVVSGVPLHIIQRGNNRQPCFFDDQDYGFFLKCLAKVAEKYRCDIHAYVLMTNHVHLLLTPSSEEGPSRLMQAVGRRYVQYVNYKYQRTGTLWEGRFKASLVQSEDYLLSCYRYIELNPVRAGIVDRPEYYKWSSHRVHLGLEPNRFMTSHALFEALGANVEARRAAYLGLFDQYPDASREALIRQSIHNNLPTGSDQFREKIGAILRRNLMPARPGRRCRAAMDVAEYLATRA